MNDEVTYKKANLLGWRVEHVHLHLLLADGMCSLHLLLLVLYNITQQIIKVCGQFLGSVVRDLFSQLAI